MKQLLLLTFSLVIAMGCQTKDSTKPMARMSPAPIEDAPKINARNPNRVYNKTDPCIPNDPYDCVILYEGVDVRPKKTRNPLNLTTVLDEAITAGPAGIARAFRSDEILNHQLAVVLGNEMLRNLQSGSYHLLKVGETEHFTKYYLGASFPLTDDNKELVLQIDK